MFCSETLQRLSDEEYRGTMHRVGKAENPRLSMVYKMRHREDIDVVDPRPVRFVYYPNGPGSDPVELEVDQ